MATTFRPFGAGHSESLRGQGWTLEALRDQRWALGALRGQAGHWKRFVINAGHSERVLLHVAITTEKLRQQVSREAAACCSHGRKPMEKITLNPAPKGRQEKPNNWIPN